MNVEENLSTRAGRFARGERGGTSSVHGSLGSRFESRFSEVADALCAVSDASLRFPIDHARRGAMPSRDAILSIVENLRSILFPQHFGALDRTTVSFRYSMGARLDEAALGLEEQVRRGLALSCHHEVMHPSSCALCGVTALEIVEGFVSSLPRIRDLLEADVSAAFDGDPAATFPDETLYCYPGVTAITQHRIAHELYRAGVPLIPRMIAQQSHAATGIDIHPGARIGRSFFIDHGTGVVIGETCEIGERVRLYQGVTLGARDFPSGGDGKLLRGLPRHPVVGDDVVIYAGATILGRVSIGSGTTISGNVWLTRSVPPGSRVSQAHARHVRHGQGSGI